MIYYISEVGFASVFGPLDTAILSHREHCFTFLKMAADLVSER